MSKEWATNLIQKASKFIRNHRSEVTCIKNCTLQIQLTVHQRGKPGKNLSCKYHTNNFAKNNCRDCDGTMNFDYNENLNLKYIDLGRNNRRVITTKYFVSKKQTRVILSKPFLFLQILTMHSKYDKVGL